MDAQTEAIPTSTSEAVPAHHFPSLIERYYTQRFATGTPYLACRSAGSERQSTVFLTQSVSALLDVTGPSEDIYVYCHTNGYAKS